MSVNYKRRNLTQRQGAEPNVRLDYTVSLSDGESERFNEISLYQYESSVDDNLVLRAVMIDSDKVTGHQKHTNISSYHLTKDEARALVEHLNRYIYGR